MSVGNVAANVSPHPKNNDLSISGFSPDPSTQPIRTMSWFTIVIAVLATVAFWLLDISASQSLSEKRSEKDLVFQTIQSAEYSDVNANILGFVSAYEKLKEVSGSHYAFSEFIPKLYTKMNSDITLSNLEISNTGSLSINGKAPSYRAVADQMVALQNWPVLYDVELVTVNLNMATSGSVEVPFVISANIDQSVSLADAEVSASSTINTSDSTTAAESAIFDQPDVSASGVATDPSSSDTTTGGTSE